MIKEMIINPTSGNPKNVVAGLLKLSARIVWIGGFIAGLMMGSQVGKLQNNLSGLLYGKSGGEFSHSVAFTVWILAFFSGLLIYGFAEIISLLQVGNTIAYHVNPEEDEAAKADDEAETKPEGSVPSKKQEFDIESSNMTISCPFALRKLILEKATRAGADIKLWIVVRAGEVPTGILADITFSTIFGEEYKITGIPFINFEKKGSYYHVSDGGFFEFPSDIMSSAVVSISKYVIGNTPLEPEKSSEADGNWSRYINDVELMDNIMSMSSVEEIFNYLTALAQVNEPIVTEELMELVKKKKEGERLYGNNYASCVEDLRKFFGFDTNEDQGTEKAESMKQLYCRNCGKEIKHSEATFCPFCGAKVKEGE
ncbi:MAG: zinc ribbon domain-containing protein [Lachnospiraceae bacterium]|nr:zinc ribbon domain-containing protein [Lachnospiraceae bacterium]